MSLVCDGVATDPALIHVRYIPTSTPLQLTLDTPTFTPTLMFEPALPDGTYSIEATTGETPYDPNKVMTSGAELSGTFTFTRSRDVPFADIAEPEAKPYTSTIDATFNLVAVLPHPDPSMGTGCRLETGEQHVMLSVSGPVEECTSHPTLGAH